MDKQVGINDEQSSWLVRDRVNRRYPNINKQLLFELYCVQGMSFVHGLKTFLEQQGIPVAPKSIQPKEGTALFEVSNQESIRLIAQQMYQYGSIWLQRKKDIFDLLG